MPARTPHVERHFGGSEVVRDIVLGMSDGLTVPFALAAGLSGAAAGTHIVITAGLAEIVAGAISMGLGGYLAGQSMVEHYASERKRELREVAEMPREEEAEVRAVFRDYGLSPEQIEPIVISLRKDPQAWVDFMMRFELGLEKPAAQSALRGAVTIGGAYAVGGLIPLTPYLLISGMWAALRVSIVVTFVALFAFGYLKGRLTSTKPWRGAIQTLMIGGLAAATAFLLARAIS